MADKPALEQRAQRAILQEAFFRWESAVVIALALILATATSIDLLNILPAWAWLVGGLGAEAALVYSSLSDPEFARKVVADLLQRDFRPEGLRDKQLQGKVQQALDYRSRIEQAIRERPNSLLKDELNQTAGQIDEWIENIYDLAQRIDRYQQEQKILSRDKNQAQLRRGQLKKELATERDPAVQRQIQATLQSINRQLDTLDKLENTIQRAELQLESTLTHLGTIYSQTMLVDAKDIDSGRARRLRQEIAEEVTELNDVLLAMDDVYSAETAV